jgi:hypothetical protein
MSNINLQIILAIAGSVALLIGLFGGGVKAKELEVPKISALARILSALVGIALIGTAIKLPYSSQPSELSTPTPLPSSTPPAPREVAAVPSATQDPIDTPTTLPTSTPTATVPVPTDTPTPTDTPVPAPAYIHQETISIPVDGSSVTSSTILENGVTYKIIASGTLIADNRPGVPVGLGDAEYTHFNIPSGLQSNCFNSPDGVDLGLGINDDIIDNSKTPFWGEYNSSNVYQIRYIGQGLPIRFNYHDCNYADNSGTLIVEIFRVSN